MNTDPFQDTTHEKELIYPQSKNNFYCWLSGALILAANKVRHTVQGYITPRTFPISDFDRAVEYDISVVTSWKHYLDRYTGTATGIEGMNILELGPGADLGIGLLLLAHGAGKYCALDINNLVESVPDEFYTALFKRIETEKISKTNLSDLKKELECTRNNENHRLNYICDKNFDLNRFKSDDIDLVFSQAAFEHFDNIPHTFSQLSTVVQQGCILIAEIDLSTHTRWIRDFDPLNIYRYSDWYYNLTRFRGSPNRVRPHQYKEILEDLGWKDVRVIPRRQTHNHYINGIKHHLAAQFKKPAEEVGMLSVILCATR